jgi:hypothetical protein
MSVSVSERYIIGTHLQTGVDIPCVHVHMYMYIYVRYVSA